MIDHTSYRLAERRLRAAYSRASGFNRAECRTLLARVRYWRRSRYHSDDDLKLGLWQPLIDMACRMASR